MLTINTKKANFTIWSEGQHPKVLNLTFKKRIESE